MPFSFLASLLRRLRHPSTVYLAAGVLGKLGSLFLIPLYLGRLDVVDYGSYGLAQTLVGLAPSLLSLGAIGAINRFYFAQPDAAAGRRDAGTICRWVALASLTVALVVGLPLVLTENPLRTIFGRAGLVYILIACVGSTWLAFPSLLLRCEQRAYAAAAFQVAELLLVLVSGVFFVGIEGHGFAGSLEALGAAYIVGAAISVAFFAVSARGPWNVKLGIDAFRFSAALLPHYVAVWIQGAAERWALKLVGDDADLGRYALASQLASPANVVVAAWNQDRSAKHGAMVREGGLNAIRDRFVWIRASYFLAALGPGLVTLACIPLLRLFIGRSYSSALAYMPGVLVAVILDALYHPYNHVVYYADRPRWIPIATTVSAVVSLVANAILVAPLGVIGAIAARCITSGARLATMSYAARLCFKERAAHDATPKT